MSNQNEIEEYLTGIRSSVSNIFRIDKSPLYLQIVLSVSIVEFMALKNKYLEVEYILDTTIHYLQHQSQSIHNSQNFRQLCLYICFEVNLLLKKSKNSIGKAIQIVLFMLQETPISEDKTCLDLFSTIISSLHIKNYDSAEILQREVKTMLNKIVVMKKMKVIVIT